MNKKSNYSPGEEFLLIRLYSMERYVITLNSSISSIDTRSLASKRTGTFEIAKTYKTLMPYTKSFKDYLTGSTIDLKSFHDLCGIPLIMNCDAGNKSYVDHVVNNIIDGSEPFQGDVSMNNNRIKNVHTTVSDYDTVNRFFCDVKYLKNTDGFNFLMKISNDRR